MTISSADLSPFNTSQASETNFAVQATRAAFDQVVNNSAKVAGVTPAEVYFATATIYSAHPTYFFDPAQAPLTLILSFFLATAARAGSPTKIVTKVTFFIFTIEAAVAAQASAYIAATRAAA